jgi:hypothetical protein
MAIIHCMGLRQPEVCDYLNGSDRTLDKLR